MNDPKAAQHIMPLSPAHRSYARSRRTWLLLAALALVASMAPASAWAEGLEIRIVDPPPPWSKTLDLSATPIVAASRKATVAVSVRGADHDKAVSVQFFLNARPVGAPIPLARLRHEPLPDQDGSPGTRYPEVPLRPRGFCHGPLALSARVNYLDREPADTPSSVPLIVDCFPPQGTTKLARLHGFETRDIGDGACVATNQLLLAARAADDVGISEVRTTIQGIPYRGPTTVRKVRPPLQRQHFARWVVPLQDHTGEMRRQSRTLRLVTEIDDWAGNTVRHVAKLRNAGTEPWRDETVTIASPRGAVSRKTATIVEGTARTENCKYPLQRVAVYVKEGLHCGGEDCTSGAAAPVPDGSWLQAGIADLRDGRFRLDLPAGLLPAGPVTLAVRPIYGDGGASRRTTGVSVQVAN